MTAEQGARRDPGNAPGTLPAGVVNLQGKPYPTWAYTLDTAHTLNTAPLVRFLGITTQIVQLPTPENGLVAVVQATVRWRNAEGDSVEFGGIGDATPQNCGPVGRSALLRMAEVRAKGRALRDSVNIGDVLAEELSGAAGDQGAGDQGAGEGAALTKLQRALHARTQGDREGKILLVQYLKKQGKERISEMDAGEVAEWLLIFNDRQVTPTLVESPL